MIAGAYLLALNFADQLPAVQGGHSPWRYTLLFGVLPAIPLMILRPFLPESPLWAATPGSGDPVVARAFASCSNRGCGA